jgi:hypothetical protein
MLPFSVVVVIIINFSVLLFGNYGKIIQKFGNFLNLHQKYGFLNFFLSSPLLIPNFFE